MVRIGYVHGETLSDTLAAGLRPHLQGPFWSLCLVIFVIGRYRV
jgi:hypothetical protein